MTAAAWGHLAMFTFAVLVSGSYSASALAAPHMDPAALTLLRFAIATAILSCVLLVMVRRKPDLWSRQALAAPWRYVVLGGLLGFYFVLLFKGLPLSDPTSAALLFATTPLMSAGIGRVLLHQRAPFRVLAPLLIAAAGAVWVIFRADLSALLAFDLGEGEAIIFLGCVLHAFYTPMIRRLNRGESTPVFTLGMMMGGVIVLVVFGARGVIEADWAELPLVVWVSVAYIAVFASTICFLLMQFAALRLTAAKTMAYIYLVPSGVVVIEGALGHGWPETAILPGIVATIVALLMLLRD